MKTKLVNGIPVVMGAEEAEQFELSRPVVVSMPTKKAEIEILKDALIAKGLVTVEDLDAQKGGK